MTTPAPICFSCKHATGLNSSTPFCSAFPKGIPEKIFYEGSNHFVPTENQENKIVYEKKATK